MRCPACHTENPVDAPTCRSCQASLVGAARRARKRNAAAETESPQTLEYNRQVKGIFHLCLVSLVPFLGLVLGPLGASRAWRLLQQARSDPAFTAERAALAAVLLGTLTGVTNWLGLGVMLLGLFLDV